MNQSDTIRKVLETHRIRPKVGEFMQKCAGCPWIGWNHDIHVAETVDLALTASRWITTVEQLEAIPRKPNTTSGPLIKSMCLVDPENGNYGMGTVYEGNDDGTWQDFDAGTPTRLPSTQIPLPALLLWEP